MIQKNFGTCAPVVAALRVGRFTRTIKGASSSKGWISGSSACSALSRLSFLFFFFFFFLPILRLNVTCDVDIVRSNYHSGDLSRHANVLFIIIWKHDVSFLSRILDRQGIFSLLIVAWKLLWLRFLLMVINGRAWGREIVRGLLSPESLPVRSLNRPHAYDHETA